MVRQLVGRNASVARSLLQTAVYERYIMQPRLLVAGVGSCKNSACSILATLHPTGCKYVNMSVTLRNRLYKVNVTLTLYRLPVSYQHERSRLQPELRTLTQTTAESRYASMERRYTRLPPHAGLQTTAVGDSFNGCNRACK
jgi:hypothetical protein